jgi:8-oxo-dGTP diphosphatase
VSSEPLRVVAAAILQERKLLLVSKHAAPDLFYLPGGKPDEDEEPLETLEREVREELGVGVVESERLTVVHERAALEGVPMEMEVYRCVVEGSVEPRAEIAALAWVGSEGPHQDRLAPAIRNHVLPFLAELGLIA